MTITSALERILEKTARRECQAAVEAELGSVILEDRAYLRQVEPDGMEVGMRESNLRSSVALGCAYIANGLVVFKGKPSSDSEGTAMAEAGHSTQEALETLGIGVECLETRLTAAADFILREAAPQAFSQVPPVTVEALAGHFQDAANVGGLLLVEKKVSGRRIAIVSIAALEKAEGDESIEEVSRRPRMQADAILHSFKALGLVCQLCKEAQFDGTEKCF